MLRELEDWGSGESKRASAAPLEVDLGLQGERLGEVPIAQVSDGHPFALRLHFCWDWKKPEWLSCWQDIPLSTEERMNGEC